jgi:hypothetical protein
LGSGYFSMFAAGFGSTPAGQAFQPIVSPQFGV